MEAGLGNDPHFERDAARYHRNEVLRLQCGGDSVFNRFDRRKVRPVGSGQSPDLELIRRKGRAREASDVFEQTRM